MAQEALRLWRELEAEAGKSSSERPAGSISARGPTSTRTRWSSAVLHSSASMQREAERRFPPLAAPRGRRRCSSRTPASLWRTGQWRVHRRRPNGNGADVRERTRVTALTVERRPGRGAHRGGNLPPAGRRGHRGGVGPRLLGRGRHRSAVRPTRETVAYLPDRRGDSVDRGVDHPGGVRAGRPGRGIKAAGTMPVATPTPTGRRAPTRARSRGSRAGIAERLPDVDPTPAESETCLYTNTADESFILERRGPVVIGSPCSGHGFKFAPAIGERLSVLARSRGMA